MPDPGKKKKSKRTAIIAGSTALVILVAGAIFAWTYFTGRLGFGPLSAEDEAAAETIAAEAEAPDWADEAQRACAAEELLHESRSGDLESAGTIAADDTAESGWAYAGTWAPADATTYATALLDCSEDWAAQLGEAWNLEDTGCLSELGVGTMAGYFASDLELSEEGALTEDRDATVEQLDECYAEDPEAPKATATSAYRAVTFKVTSPDVENAEATINVGQDGDWETLGKDSFTVDTDRGGQKACVTAQTVATYAWGTEKTAEQKSCGKSKPIRVWWNELNKCDPPSGWPSSVPCRTWELHYEGLPSFVEAKFKLTADGGDCGASGGTCAFTEYTLDSGRGTAGTWTAQKDFGKRFVATYRGHKAVLPL